MDILSLPDVGLVILGFVLLMGGGELVVQGAITIANRLRVPPLLIGFTVVAIGTSLPELAVAIEAVGQDAPDIAVGGVLGSNVANVMLVLGTASVIGAASETGQGIYRDAMAVGIATAILLIFSGLSVIFLAGVRWRYLLTMIAFVAAIALYLWYQLHDHQRTRIVTMFNPWDDPMGSGYHIIQSQIAVGSAGIAGKGWLNGTQSQLEFIPERSTDFIFAVYAEEFGLIGAIVLIVLYLFVVGRALVLAYKAEDSYTRLLVGSLALTFFFYIFVNTAMVTGVLPVVGIPLPLISYGGTSMVTVMAAFGVIMSASTHKRLMR